GDRVGELAGGEHRAGDQHDRDPPSHDARAQQGPDHQQGAHRSQQQPGQQQDVEVRAALEGQV
ncbi:MAG: hypothetical protein AVDCRST_MAG06-28, partial [uncultured Nocardioides sp.]